MFSPLWPRITVSCAFAFLIAPMEAWSGVPASSTGRQAAPCDILGQAGTACVAAHSMTRALYARFDGPLYRVRRADGEERDIRVAAQGGLADAAAQDRFCGGRSCTVVRIYDQSPEHNDLRIEGQGQAGAADRGADAAALPITLAGHRVYGLSIAPGMGYRNDDTRGVARDGQPETVFMVTSDLHVNAQCCFDYGNVERNNRDTGNGHMDALNFSMICGARTCLGSGPWVQADLENGLFMSADGGNARSSYRGDPWPFVTALLKNDGQHFFALRSGNAQGGPLASITAQHEALPGPSYAPMHQEGAIVLGTGGDNSNGAVGSFFEGVMTRGVTTTRTDDAVEANIVAARYGGLPRR